MNFWIVVGPRGPATNPRQHSSEEMAEAEASRLARLHKGTRFEVWCCRPVLAARFNDVLISRLDTDPEDDLPF